MIILNDVSRMARVVSLSATDRDYRICHSGDDALSPSLQIAMPCSGVSLNVDFVQSMA